MIRSGNSPDCSLRVNQPPASKPKKYCRRGVSILVAPLCLLLVGHFWLLDHDLVPHAGLLKDRSPQLLPVNPASPPTKPIEAVQVGQRVAFLENPIEPFDSSLGYEVDSATWRQIELRPNDHSRVVLLRPQWWIDSRLNRDRTRLRLAVPEVGIFGESDVVSVRPCPQLATGSGSVVTGTFAHTAVETIELHVEGLAEPIRCTPNHPFWSPTRQEFVEATDLRHSDFVQGLHGLHRVTQIERVPAPVRVYNLEVHGHHVYQVSHPGFIVHNAPCAALKGGIVAQNGTTITGYTKHGINRATGNGFDRAGTSPKAILEALKNPKGIKSGVDDLGRPFEIFTGPNARVVVNPQAGEIVSVNPLGGGGVRGR